MEECQLSPMDGPVESHDNLAVNSGGGRQAFSFFFLFPSFWGPLFLYSSTLHVPFFILFFHLFSPSFLRAHAF